MSYLNKLKRLNKIIITGSVLSKFQSEFIERTIFIRVLDIYDDVDQSCTGI